MPKLIRLCVVFVSLAAIAATVEAAVTRYGVETVKTTTVTTTRTYPLPNGGHKTVTSTTVTTKRKVYYR